MDQTNNKKPLQVPKINWPGIIELCKAIKKPDQGINIHTDWLRRTPEAMQFSQNEFMNVQLAKDHNNFIYVLYDLDYPIDFPELFALHELGQPEAGEIRMLDNKRAGYKPEVITIGEKKFAIAFKQKIV